MDVHWRRRHEKGTLLHVHFNCLKRFQQGWAIIENLVRSPLAYWDFLAMRIANRGGVKKKSSFTPTFIGAVSCPYLQLSLRRAVGKLKYFTIFTVCSFFSLSGQFPGQLQESGATSTIIRYSSSSSYSLLLLFLQISLLFVTIR